MNDEDKQDKKECQEFQEDDDIQEIDYDYADDSELYSENIKDLKL